MLQLLAVLQGQVHSAAAELLALREPVLGLELAPQHSALQALEQAEPQHFAAHQALEAGTPQLWGGSGQNFFF